MLIKLILFSTLTALRGSASTIGERQDAKSLKPVLLLNTQHLHQDSKGLYDYGYSNGESSKQESRSSDGVTRGSYSYVDAHGQLQAVTYEADATRGFTVVSSSIPKVHESSAPGIPETETETKAQKTIAEEAPLTTPPRIDANNNDLPLQGDKEKSLHVVYTPKDVQLQYIYPARDTTYAQIPLNNIPVYHREDVMLQKYPVNYYNIPVERLLVYPALQFVGAPWPPYTAYEGLPSVFSNNIPLPAETVQFHSQNRQGDFVYGYVNTVGQQAEEKHLKTPKTAAEENGVTLQSSIQEPSPAS